MPIIKITPEIRSQIIHLIKACSLSYAQIGAQFGVGEWSIAQLAVRENIRRGRGAASPSHKNFRAKESDHA